MLIRINLINLVFSSFANRPHKSGVFGHRKRSFSKTLTSNDHVISVTVSFDNLFSKIALHVNPAFCVFATFFLRLIALKKKQGKKRKKTLNSLIRI